MARELIDAHLIGWHFRWDKALRRLGCTHYGTRTITLSRPLCESISRKAAQEVILHEIAHAKAGHKAGHGPVWQAEARALGSNASRCYDASEVTKVAPKWVGVCPVCGQEYPRLRRPTKARAACAKHGRWDVRYVLVWQQQ